MLVEFRVKNFGCLRDEQVLSLVPASDDQSLWDNNTFDTGVRTVPRLLRTAVLYGPNAGGKSTVLRALRTMLDMVVLSAGIETNRLPFPAPFLLDDVSLNAPTAFEISFLQEGRRYQYGFSCQGRRILEEYLFEYKSDRPTTLFNRHYDKENDKDVYAFGKSLRGPKRVWQDATQGSALFLSRAAQLNSEQLSPLWRKTFRSSRVYDKFSILSPNLFIEQILGNAKLKENICNFIRSVDIDIKDLEIKKNYIDKTYVLSFTHSTRHGDITLPSWAESDGTMRLLSCLAPLLQALGQGGILAIDELHASLHPLIVRRIVDLFHSPKSNPHGAQLIFTTQDP